MKTSLTLPAPEPGWVSLLAGILSERDAAIVNTPSPERADAALQARRHEVATWLSGTGADAVRSLQNRLSRSGQGYRLQADTDLNAGSLKLSLTRGGEPVLDYTLSFSVSSEGVIPRRTMRVAGGPPRSGAFLARIEGAVNLRDISADDLASDFTRALAESGNG